MDPKKEIIGLRKQITRLRWIIYYSIVKAHHTTAWPSNEAEEYKEETMAFENETDELKREYRRTHHRNAWDHR